MITYIEGLKTRYPDLYTMARPLLESFRPLTLQCTHQGFNATKVELFENFHNACKEILPKLKSYDIPVGDWRQVVTLGGRLTTFYPYYWTIFCTAIKQIAHMSLLLLHLRQGRLKPYVWEIQNLAKYTHLSALPLNVTGPNFRLKNGAIPSHWIESMLYMEIQFNIIGRANIAAQYWRQSFPHGAACDLELAYDNAKPSWWLTIEAEKLVSADYVAAPMKSSGFTEFVETMRAELSPVPKGFSDFVRRFPGFVQSFFGASQPNNEQLSQTRLVEDLWEWVAIYEYIGPEIGAGNYLVIPHNVSVLDFVSKWKPEWRETKVTGVKPSSEEDEKAMDHWPWFTE